MQGYFVDQIDFEWHHIWLRIPYMLLISRDVVVYIDVWVKYIHIQYTRSW